VVEDQYDSIVHHKPTDTLDKVDDHDLTTGAAMLAVTAHAFADADVRPAPRLSWTAERQPEARDLRLCLGAGAQLRWVSLMVVTGLTRPAVALRRWRGWAMLEPVMHRLTGTVVASTRYPIKLRERR
jgi:hypothetical protein